MKRLTILSVAVVLTVVNAGCGAKIEETCTMNGLGMGECQFTNTGNFSGRMCGRIIVSRPEWTGSTGSLPRRFDRKQESAVFCSGKVEKSDTTSVSFHVPGVQELCYDPREDWQEKCNFTFEEQE